MDHGFFAMVVKRVNVSMLILVVCLVVLSIEELRYDDDDVDRLEILT